MRLAGWALAYRGCDAAECQSVLMGGHEARISTNKFDWLGTGAYFWENSPARAAAWARFLQGKRNSPVHQPSVLGAIIDPGNCLDLANEACLQLLKADYTEFEQSCSQAGVAMPKNEQASSSDPDLVKRHLDCAVINYLHAMRNREGLPEFDTVRCPFMEGGELFRGAKIAAQTHVQWAVRNPRKSIIGYFRPRPDATQP